MGSVSKEKAAVVWDGLLGYEKNTEHGVPCDFLDAYRYGERTRRDLKNLPAREQEKYFARLRGDDTVDNLRKDLDKLYSKARIYGQVLRSHGLFDKAVSRIQTAKEESYRQTQRFKELRLANPDEELPFD